MAKTDRELVDAAAKAAGIVGQPVLTFGGMPAIRRGNEFEPWQPLTDDGDALRLAARLKIDIHYEYNGPTMGDIVEAMSPPDEGDWSRICMAESTAKDAAAATRRAIVRAAAAMAVGAA